MADLLIELFSEEIPARMQPKAREDLKKLVTDGLVAAGLTYASAGAFSTPRRLALSVEGLDAASKPVREERKGPRTDAPQPAIDRAVIEQFRELDPDGSMALAARILGIYADSSGSVFADIEQSMANGDGELLRRAAHSLKSSSANVGARQLSVLLKEFELLGKENRVDEARAQFDALRAEYARAQEGIRALLLEFES